MFVWWRGGEISCVLCDGVMERLVVCLVMEKCRDHLGVCVMETWRD